MNTKTFKSQKEATEYYGRTWAYICKHYTVKRCMGGDCSGVKYVISK